MKKLLFSLVVAFGLGLVNRAEAASARGEARTGTAVNYTTTVSSISTTAAMVYQVVLSTGASTEYVALHDAASSAALSNTTLKTRVVYSSTTQNTVVTFDPPLQFNRGVYAVPSAATGQALIIFGKGRSPGN
jgi:hypothetical protein